jgi:hypothetical protein
MAALAVGVQGVAPFGIAVWAMAIFTTTRFGIFLFFVMAIVARKPIPLVSGMGLVIKQDASRGRLQHESHRFFRDLGRKSRVADNTYSKQDCRKGKCQRLFIL